MSAKVKDDHNRWRNKTVAFRMSPEEAEKLDRFVRISGLKKQEYLIKRALQEEIVVSGSVRTYKMLRNELSLLIKSQVLFQKIQWRKWRHNKETVLKGGHA